VLVERFANLPEQLAALVETLSLREKIPQVELAAGDPPPGSGPSARGEAALVFRVMELPVPSDLDALRAFGERHGVQVYLQSGGLDSIEPLREGYPPLEYSVDDPPIAIEFGPADFIQVNRDVNVSMVAAAMRLLAPTPADSVLDLFCGLGNFTLSLAARAGRAVGVEGDAALVAKARANALRNGAANAEFHAENLFEPQRLGSWAQDPYDLVLLDPPRAGAAEILERMAQWRPRRVVYISCHPGSLARDAGVLAGVQGYRLTGAGVMDMFPHTTHVESIAVFEKDP
jgi:23S rRNA (uracil1939-C5)-methyltransferase